VRQFVGALGLDADRRRFERHACDLSLEVISSVGSMRARATEIGLFGIGGEVASCPDWFRPGLPIEVRIEGASTAVTGRIAHVEDSRFGIMLIETEETRMVIGPLLDRMKPSQARRAA
jgi:hypothetical protein